MQIVLQSHTTKRKYKEKILLQSFLMISADDENSEQLPLLPLYAFSDATNLIILANDAKKLHKMAAWVC